MKANEIEVGKAYRVTEAFDALRKGVTAYPLGPPDANGNVEVGACEHYGGFIPASLLEGPITPPEDDPATNGWGF